jgi:hypothetical protein
MVQDFVDCWHGSAGGCAWAASNFIPGKALGKVAEAIRALAAAMTTGIGVTGAFKALKALGGIDPATPPRSRARSTRTKTWSPPAGSTAFGAPLGC